MSDSCNMMTKILFTLLFSMIFIVVANNFYTFYYQKNYKFIVETPCDPTEQTCFIRHCDENDECPPNGLEQYRLFNLKASDFPKCSSDSCLDECLNSIISCEEVKCNESSGDACFSTISIVE